MDISTPELLKPMAISVVGKNSKVEVRYKTFNLAKFDAKSSPHKNVSNFSYCKIVFQIIYHLYYLCSLIIDINQKNFFPERFIKMRFD